MKDADYDFENAEEAYLEEDLEGFGEIYSQLAEAIQYVEEHVEDVLEAELGEPTLEELSWGSIEGPIILQLEKGDQGILDSFDESDLDYQGRFVEIDYEPRIFLEFKDSVETDREASIQGENLGIFLPE